MIYGNLALEDLKTDLRSAKGTQIQRGFSIKFLRVLILVALDIISLRFAWYLTSYYGTQSSSTWTEDLSFLLLTLSVQIFIIATTNLYKAGKFRRDYFSIIKATSLSQILLVFLTFLYEANTYISRDTFLLYWLLSTVSVCMLRFIFDVLTKFVRQKGAVRYSIFVIADADEKEEQLKLIEQDYYTVQGFADSTCLDLAHRDRTFEYLRSQGIAEVFVSWNSIKNRLYVCWHFYTAGITLRILPIPGLYNHPKTKFIPIGEIPCASIPAPVVVGGEFWVKRFFDICASLVLILLLSPLYLILAALIKLDSPGPILFKQKRIGLHGQEFKMWKFRSMVTDAEKILQTLESKNEMKDGVLFKMKNDPRVTRVGKIIRSTSLDELPQLFNVLFGEMSLVGPRPLPLRDVEKFQTKHFIRQEVLPGITGLWQVTGRSQIENFEDVVKLDVDYIENWSLWLDFKILLLTFKAVLDRTGAY